MAKKKNTTSQAKHSLRPTPIVTLHEGYIRVILDRKIVVIDLDSENVEQFIRKSRLLIGT